MKELGVKLRKIREEKDVSLTEIQKRTKIRKKYLVALEEGRVDVIPGKVYLKGFLKSYCRALDLPGDEILAEYNAWLEEQDNRQEDEQERLGVKKEEDGFSRFIVHLTVIIIVAIIIGFSVYNIFWLNSADEDLGLAEISETEITEENGIENDDQGDPEQELANDTEHEDESNNISELEVNDRQLAESMFSPQQLEVDESALLRQEEPLDTVEEQEIREDIFGFRVIEETWARITADGEQVFEGFLEEGDERLFSEIDELRIRFGNAGGIVLIEGDKPTDEPLGQRGEVKEVLLTRNNH